MNRRPWSLCALLLCAFDAFSDEAAAQDRPWCDPTNTPSSCPGDRCPCADESFELYFGESEGSVFQYSAFRRGLAIPASVVLNAQTPMLEAWAFALDHDEAFLRLVSAQLEGAAAQTGDTGGFATAALGDTTQIFKCSDPYLDICRDPVPDRGLICGVILSFTQPMELPAGRHVVCSLDYTLQADVSREGTTIAFSNQLAFLGARPYLTALSIEGKSRLPRSVRDGIVRGTQTSLRRGDVDQTGRAELTDAVRMLGCLFLGTECAICLDAADVDDNGLLNIGDPVRLLSWLFLDAAIPPEPFLNCGIDATADAIPECTESPECK